MEKRKQITEMRQAHDHEEFQKMLQGLQTSPRSPASATRNATAVPCSSSKSVDAPANKKETSRVYQVTARRTDTGPSSPEHVALESERLFSKALTSVAFHTYNAHHGIPTPHCEPKGRQAHSTPATPRLVDSGAILIRFRLLP